MNRNLFLIIGVVFFMSCVSTGRNGEMSAAGKIGLKKKDVGIIREISGGEISPLAALGEDYSGKDGLVVTVDFRASYDANNQLRSIYVPKGYQVFVARQNFNKDGRKNLLAIIRTQDKYDVLRVQQTCYPEKGMSVADMIRFLGALERKYQTEFSFVGAENSWVKMEFGKMPERMDLFTKELTGRFPQLLDDGSGEIGHLQAKLEKRKSVILYLY